MPVVQVRQVSVAVEDRCVHVRVRVAHVGNEPWVLVVVVAVVMTVAVDVLLRRVCVLVSVLVEHEERHADGEQECRAEVLSAELLAEERERQSRAEERRAREGDLGARGPEMLRRRDVEHDAHAV